MRKTRGLMVRFYERFDSSDGPDACWPWIGTLNRAGYGVIVDNRRQRMATHVALQFADRPVPGGMFACHNCDNPPCVNPAHLFIGTIQENHRDMVLKGRIYRGPRSPEWRARQSSGLLAFYARKRSV